MRYFRTIALPLIALLLSGCDLMVVSSTMPGLIWPVGKPLTGVVTDADTGLPLGRATVVCGWGYAQTDSMGRFALYGALSADSISASRAGYTSVTYRFKGSAKDGQPFALYPLFPNKGDLPARYANVSGQSPLRSGGIMFSERTSNSISSDGRFLLDLKAALPGTIYSGVLASGNTVGGKIDDANSSFYFDNFGYDFVDVPFLETPAQAEATPFTVNPSAPSAEMQAISLSFTNLSGLTNVLSEIALDFGMRGDILVARQRTSTPQIKIPTKVGMVYALEGSAYNSDRSLSSKVTISTNSLSNSVVFDLMPPPEPISPKAKEVTGGRPTFRWKYVDDATQYVVKVFENGDPRPKWIGYTPTNSITFPAFPDGDLNGGALLSGQDLKYTWSVVAVGSGDGDSVASGIQAPPSRPFRQTSRESAAANGTAGNMEFVR